MKEEIRHELVMLPYHSVFDWLEAEVQQDGTVILRGEVTRPTLKTDAEIKVRALEGVNRISNTIEVMPVSDHDEDLRRAVYRAVYASDSPLFKYAHQSVGPIHILVKNGHVTLKGVVDNEADGQIAFIRARGVSGAFSVKNELQTADGSKPIS